MNADILKEREAVALKAIKSLYGKPDGEHGPTLFASHHLSEVEPAYWLRIVDTEQPNPDQVLSTLVSVGSWTSMCDETIDTFHFGLPGNVSNYFLSIRFQDGQVQYVAIES